MWDIEIFPGRLSGRIKKITPSSEKKYRTMIENSGDAIGICQNDTFVFANDSLAKMIGYHIKEILSIDTQLIFSEKVISEMKDRILKSEIDATSLMKETELLGNLAALHQAKKDEEKELVSLLSANRLLKKLIQNLLTKPYKTKTNLSPSKKFPRAIINILSNINQNILFGLNNQF